MVTREEFERGYAKRSGLTVEELRSHGRVVVRCWCGDRSCDGWASVSADAAIDYAPGGIYHVAQSQIGAEAEAFASEFKEKAARARIPLVRRWYERRAAAAWKIARSEEEPGAR
jgi:hypothetical protein